MSFEQLMGTVQGMSTAMDRRRDRRTSLNTGDCRSEHRVGARAVSSGGRVRPGLDPPPQQAMLALIRMFPRRDLLAEPGRAPGWTFTDPNVVDGYGRGSMMVPVRLAGEAELANVASFLDVGTGVGLLAVSAANVWPAATVVGIDVWEPSLERAHANVGGAGLDDRITLRNQDLAARRRRRIRRAWVPTFFVPDDVLKTGLARSCGR
jgi:hypothetical protein